MFLYRKKGKSAKVPVTICEILTNISISTGDRTTRRGKATIVGYVVKSEFGGRMLARLGELRPGNALDRIAAALEED
jgi:hypothetical protein